jgi:hypothetical protein
MNNSFYHFPGDDELLENIGAVEKNSAKQREGFGKWFHTRTDCGSNTVC